MTKAEKLALARTNARNQLVGKLAQDAKPEDVDAILTKFAQDAAEAEADEKKAEDEDDDPELKDKPKPKPAEDGDDDDKDDDKPTKAAMDAAIKHARTQATADATKHLTALFESREVVKPLVGVVAMDSADDVYKFALDQAKVDITGVHPSAYKSMVGMLLKQSSAPAPAMGMDSATVKTMTEQNPNLARFKRA